MSESFQVAIDGPVAAGKSTVARKLAEKLGFTYVDTGAMYRAVTLAALREGVSVGDEEELVRLVQELDIDVRIPNEDEQDGRISTVVVEGEDVSWEIRSSQVSANVATVASMPKVREELVPVQRKIAENRDVIMEGRDITYVVLPDAQLKVFLTAQEDERIDRYYEKMKEQNGGLTREKASQLLRARDELDYNRKASPLRIVDEAWVLDTTGMSIDEVVENLVDKVEEIRGR